MKNLHYTMIILALCYPNPVWAVSVHDFFPVCAALSPVQGQTFIVDPSGSRKSSFPTIAAALKSAKPGDAIDLMTGDYGELAITGENQDKFITIEAAPGQTPHFTGLSIGRGKPASHWRIAGLSISNNGAPITALALVMITDGDNIVFEHNDVYSQTGSIAWQPLPSGAPMPVATGAYVDQSSCISMAENHFFNLFNGIMIGGDQKGDHGKYLLVSGNSIDNFAGDGIDHMGSHVRIEHNRITNGHDICNNLCIHTDGIQGWTWHNTPVTNTDVVISDNEIVAQTRPGLAMPADDLHGITIFDGFWDGVQIFNNVIVTDTWHGITLARAKNSSIVNNTVAPTNPSRGTWIKFYGNDKDPADTPYNVTIRNNVAPAVLVSKRDAAYPGVTIDHNLNLKDTDDFADAFVKFDPEHFAYDLHPSKKSDAKGEGSANGAPAMDIEGQPRNGKIDIGAYTHREN